MWGWRTVALNGECVCPLRTAAGLGPLGCSQSSPLASPARVRFLPQQKGTKGGRSSARTTAEVTLALSLHLPPLQLACSTATLALICCSTLTVSCMTLPAGNQRTATIILLVGLPFLLFSMDVELSCCSFSSGWRQVRSGERPRRPDCEPGVDL